MPAVTVQQQAAVVPCRSPSTDCDQAERLTYRKRLSYAISNTFWHLAVSWSCFSPDVTVLTPHLPQPCPMLCVLCMVAYAGQRSQSCAQLSGYGFVPGAGAAFFAGPLLSELVVPVACLSQYRIHIFCHGMQGSGSVSVAQSWAMASWSPCPLSSSDHLISRACRLK